MPREGNYHCCCRLLSSGLKTKTSSTAACLVYSFLCVPLLFLLFPACCSPSGACLLLFSVFLYPPPPRSASSTSSFSSAFRVSFPSSISTFPTTPPCTMILFSSATYEIPANFLWWDLILLLYAHIIVLQPRTDRKRACVLLFRYSQPVAGHITRGHPTRGARSHTAVIFFTHCVVHYEHYRTSTLEHARSTAAKKSPTLAGLAHHGPSFARTRDQNTYRLVVLADMIVNEYRTLPRSKDPNSECNSIALALLTQLKGRYRHERRHHVQSHMKVSEGTYRQLAALADGMQHSGTCGAKFFRASYHGFPQISFAVCNRGAVRSSPPQIADPALLTRVYTK